MNIQYSINKHIINKGNPTAGGWQNADTDVTALFDAVTKHGFAFSPGILKLGHLNKKPSVNDVDAALILAVDIDNGIKSYEKETKTKFERTKTLAEGYFSYNDAVNDPWLSKYASFIYTTPSHSDAHNRFRIVFVLPYRLSDPVQYSALAAAFIKKFGGDEACKNIDRLFYGNSHAEAVLFDNQLTQDAINELVALPAVEAKETKKIEQSLNKDNITYDMAKMMLNVIPGEMLDYQSWFGIVSAIGNYFSEDEAVTLIEHWAPDKQHGTVYKIKNRGAKYTIGTLVWFAKRFGFDTSVLKRKNGHVVAPDGTVKFTAANNPDEVEKVINAQSPIEAIKFWIKQNYETRYNIVKGKYEIRRLEEADFRLLDDRDVNDIWTFLKGNYYKLAAKQTVRDIIESSFSPEFNPIMAFFAALPEWDETDHIQKYINLFKVEEGQENRWKLYFKRWFVSMVACALERSENHNCIVLVGKQGIGKTTIINRLVPDELQDYYASTQIDPKDKDTRSMVAEYFLINLDELESSTKEEVGHLKSLMTDPWVTVRKPFARYILNYKRRASFIGSVNRANFLNDISGSRRWLVVDCISIDFRAEFDLTQMYAQALYMLNEGEQYWFDGKDTDYIMDFNKKYEVLSAEEELLNSLYEPYTDLTKSIEELKSEQLLGHVYLKSGTEIYNELQGKTSLRLSPIKLGQFLSKLGFSQKIIKLDGATKRVYLLKNIGDNSPLSAGF